MEELIYNQTKIPREQWRYGLRSSAAVGCGWIATYNALRLMGHPADPEELIRYYERQLPLIHGNTGTAIWGPALYFKQRGFPVRAEINMSRFDTLGKTSDVCILFYWWRNGWKLGAHFVCLQYRDGAFVGYNTYRNSVGPDRYGESLEAFLKKRKYFGTALFGIRNRAN